MKTASTEHGCAGPHPSHADDALNRLLFGLRVLEGTVTSGIILFLAAIVLQKSVFDVTAATWVDGLVRPPVGVVTQAESGSLAPPIGPFLGMLATVGVAFAVWVADRGRGGRTNRAFLVALGIAALGFLTATVIRMRNPHPDSGVIEAGTCGVVWFAGAILATGYLERLARDITREPNPKQLRSRVDFGMVIVLVSLVALAASVGIQAMQASRGKTLSFAEAPVLTLFNTLAGELLLASLVCSLVWLFAFRRLIWQMIRIVRHDESGSVFDPAASRLDRPGSGERAAPAVGSQARPSVARAAR